MNTRSKEAKVPFEEVPRRKRTPRGEVKRDAGKGKGKGKAVAVEDEPETSVSTAMEKIVEILRNDKKRMLRNALKSAAGAVIEAKVVTEIFKKNLDGVVVGTFKIRQHREKRNAYEFWLEPAESEDVEKNRNAWEKVKSLQSSLKNDFSSLMEALESLGKETQEKFSKQTSVILAALTEMEALQQSTSSPILRSREFTSKV